jgi:glycosyltransferase involved in cell wall biosynthesis
VSAAENVSVVVTTRNVERTLEACLTSIRAQDHAPLELIVVDNFSTDDTAVIAQRHADTFLTAGPERSAQRNLGIDTAVGPWVLWIDADMVLATDVVSDAVRAAHDAGAAAVSIPERTVGPGFWTACRALERACYLDDPQLFNPRLLRRDLLRRIGGFDEAMAGPEDTDLRLRLARDSVVVAHARAMIDHDEGRLTIRDVLRKRAHYGGSLPAFAAANKGSVRAQARATARAFYRHRRDLAADPAHGAGLLALRALEAGGYAWGASRAALARRR